MALTVNTNVGALNAAASAAKSNRGIEISMSRLASGKRINTGADDAAGAGIAARLTGQLKSTQQAMRNVADAISYADTAEGALSEMVNMVTRMRELYTQNSAGTLSANDKANVSLEIEALSAALTSMVASTTWGGTAFASITTAVDAAGTTQTINGALLAAPAGITSTGTADSSLQTLATARATLGASVNALNGILNNLSNYAANLQASVGTIEDADFAAETTNLVKMQVLQQAATAMLAQANGQKQGILQLLQG
jgi:flagellin